MRAICKAMSLDIPADVEVAVKSRVVTVKGPRGTLVKEFKHASVDLYLEDGKVHVALWYGVSKRQATIRSIISHISNMITGVRLGFQYKMRLVYAHFPINTTLEDKNTVMGMYHRIQLRGRTRSLTSGTTTSPTPLDERLVRWVHFAVRTARRRADDGEAEAERGAGAGSWRARAHAWRRQTRARCLRSGPTGAS